MANFIRLCQITRYQEGDTFALNVDTTTDAAGRPQEGISMRYVDNNGKLWNDTLSFKNIRYGNASCVQESMFEALEEHGIFKEEAKKRLVAVGADGASVNMGTNKGLKALP